MWLRMEFSPSPRSNALFALLSEAAYSDLAPHLELVHFPAGDVVHEPGQRLKYAVFPVSGLIGRVAMTGEGKSTEFTLCGAEGMIGLAIVFGGTAPITAQGLVHADTTAYRVPAHVMHALWRKHESFQSLMLLYIRSVLHEVTQVALCNKHHSLEQQLSRWLLTAVHRIGHGSLHVTQSVISQMLGVRREGITEAVGRLDALGIVRRERGGISVVDRPALIARSCECYGAIVRGAESVSAAGRRPVAAHSDLGGT